MSRRDAGHFYQLFDKLWKFMIMIIAYMVPPYGIKWERRRRKNIFFLYLLTDSHHDMQIMSRRDAKDEFFWEII